MSWKVEFTQGENDPPMVGWAKAIYTFDDGLTPDFEYTTPTPENGRMKIDDPAEQASLATRAQAALDAYVANLEGIAIIREKTDQAEVLLNAAAAGSAVMVARLAATEP